MFLSRLRASYGDDGDRSPWGRFWFSPIPFRGGSHTVTADAALRLTAVYACIRVIAESVMMLPFHLYTEEDDGTRVQDRKHWLYQLLARRPNDFQNPAEFRECMTAMLALRGNSMARMFSNGKGEITDLIPMTVDNTTIERLSDTNWRYIYRHFDGTESILGRGEVFHLRMFSLDGIVGMGPIQANREAVATGLSAQDYALKFFRNDATPSGGWIEMAGRFKDEEDKKKFRESWQESQTGRNRHKTAVLEGGMKYHSVGLTNRDAQFIESRKYSRSEIASMFRVPPHMIGDLDRATFSNIEQLSLDFVMYSLMPWLVRWEEGIRFQLLPDGDEHNVEFPVKSLLRGDAGARTAYYQGGIVSGWMTRNEARRMEGLDPLEGLDEPLRPLNMVEEDEAEDGADANGAPPPARPDPVPTDPQDDNEDDPRPNERLLAIADASAARIARREVGAVRSAILSSGLDAPTLDAAYERHAPFVSAALGVPIDAARAYCAEQRDYLLANDKVEEEEFVEVARMRLQRLAIRGKA
ncbi:phage portal protein [Burkholderia gladioli]|uniref:phage portal protein n=1 Tax=Burkholderia gladioli TaxID=28095 RepID=UPI00164203FB|nr:phage portal protein [Burkholderia gladioli]